MPKTFDLCINLKLKKSLSDYLKNAIFLLIELIFKDQSKTFLYYGSSLRGVVNIDSRNEQRFN